MTASALVEPGQRRSLYIRSERDRATLMEWCRRVPDGWRAEFKAPKRTDEQNDRLWELLDRVAKRMTLNGARYDKDSWKCIFMKAMGAEIKVLPMLDGTGIFPTGFRSSDLSVREMCDLQTFIEQWCAEKSVDIWEDAE